MSKSRDAFRTISEVAELLDTPAHVLRFWETKFSQVKPVKRAGGRRYYRPNDVALLAGIRQLLHDDGLTIKGVQKVLREKGVKHVAAIAPPPDLQAEPEASDAASIDAPQTDTPEVAVDEAPEMPQESATVLPFAQLGEPATTPGSAAEPASDGAQAEAAASEDQTTEATAPRPLFPEIDDPEPQAPVQGALWAEDPEAEPTAADAPEPGSEAAPEPADADALPEFITESFEDRGAAPVPPQVPPAAPIPEPADLSALPQPAPGPLAQLAALDRIDAVQAAKLAPQLAALQALLAARAGQNLT